MTRTSGLRGTGRRPADGLAQNQRQRTIRHDRPSLAAERRTVVPDDRERLFGGKPGRAMPDHRATRVTGTAACA
jgi:hypothetical protein